MLSGLKFIPRDKIDKELNDSEIRKSHKKKKKTHDNSSSSSDERISKKSRRKKWYSSEEEDDSYSDDDTSIHTKGEKNKKKKHSSSKKGKSKSRRKRGEYSSDDGEDDKKKEDGNSENIVRKEMGLEWMLRPSSKQEDNLVHEQKSASTPHEETATTEIKKVNPKELNPYFKNDGSGYPEEEGSGGSCSKLLSTSVVGDGGASWRLKALKRAQEQAAREGKHIDEVVGERWGSLGKLTVSVASGGSAAPSHAHLHAIKNRIRLQGGQNVDEEDKGKMGKKMRVPRSDDSLSWGKSRSQSQRKSTKDAAIISSALSSLQKFSNDGSFISQFKSDQKVKVASESEQPSESERPSESSYSKDIKKTPAMSANQLAAKVMQLRMKGKHQEADQLLKETHVYEEEQGTSKDATIRSTPQGDATTSRYIMHGIKTRETKKEEDADMHVARSIMRNKKFSVSGQADDEYDNDYDSKKKKQRSNENVTKSKSNTRFEKRILTQQERCNFCFENPKRPRHLVVAIANFTYLMLPQSQPLVQGHCCILPMQHELATRNVDDNVWDEIRNFKKCLLMMFAKQEKEVVFLETVIGLAKQTRHCLIECIPLPSDVAKQAPLYFKKAIDEAEEEWSQHNAKKLIDTSERGLRSSIPKDFPYFHVEFGLKKGYVHVIDDESQWKASFGINVIRGMLRLPPQHMDRHHHDSIQTQKEAVTNFARDWEPFDWTKQLD